jgi:hypothetical protein
LSESWKFACDGTAKCKESCVADVDCASGFACSNKQCVPKSTAPTCSPDGLASIPAGDAGPAEACTPYRCGTDGKCHTECTTSADCIDGRVCETASGKGLCVPAPAEAASSGGCATGRRGPRDGLAAMVAALGLAWARRGRRGRRGAPRVAR